MNERERLIELLKNAKKYATNTMAHLNIDGAIGTSYDDLQTDYLFENGVVVLPCKINDHILSHEAKDLINRQKAKIERLEKELTEYKLRLKMSGCTVDEIKSEAIKEFAERLKEKVINNIFENAADGGFAGDLLSEKTVVDEIDNLVKEMTEVVG